MERRILREALELSEHHRPYVLVQVVETRGSVPGKMGTAMLYRDDGTTLGTVGGAQLEERAKLLAREALATGRGGLHHFDLRAWEKGGLSSLCGGSVGLAVSYVGVRGHVLLWGGGHVAQALARQLDLLDLDYSIADDRPEYVGPELFARARQRWICPPKELAHRVEGSPDRFTRVYLLGYDAKKDEEAAAGLLPIFPGGVGLIASRTKSELTRRALRSRGLPEELIARLRSPIGLPLGGVTPAEIALSIAAEIVQEINEPAPPAEEETSHGVSGVPHA
jgi:xanthine dehydrogenase accessory factor